MNKSWKTAEKERETFDRIPQIGKFLRLSAILAPTGPLPISRSSWWAKVRSGEFPKPVKLGPRTTAWRIQDVVALIEKFERGDI
ncbi:helix-turn-helix transcriptional regulator [Rhizobium leguminosarum]